MDFTPQPITKLYVFIQAPDPERIGSYLREGSYGSGMAMGNDMLMLEMDGNSDSVSSLMYTLNSDMFLQRRVNRVYLCDSIAEDKSAAMATLESRAAKGKRLRVQSYAKNAEMDIMDTLESDGFLMGPKGFEQVAYIVNIDGKYFTGVHGAGMYFIRSGEHEKPISRAYYKISESIARFGITLDIDAKALDIGAAPGGWSQYLSSRVKFCVAVDPAKMEISNDKIEHIEKTFQEGINEIKAYAPYDIVVCDANIDPREVSAFVSSTPELLSDRGILLMTLKLKYKSKKSVQKAIDETLAILSKGFYKIEVKRLLSNTPMEATLCARKA